ncbi:hypothetical protein [Exiguobacterium sp. SH1S21]|uniref:hypothetical protein n=1 Tax=Exiguobacterium sp. SH1S21 TaxID=2510953 RepID=UPI001375DECD|nr:hypothetical protein [Exiguobacterium sp. SH1S21]
MDNMKRYKEAMERGRRIRQLQDESMELFVAAIQGINDVDALEQVKDQLLNKGGVK